MKILVHMHTNMYHPVLRSCCVPVLCSSCVPSAPATFLNTFAALRNVPYSFVQWHPPPPKEWYGFSNVLLHKPCSNLSEKGSRCSFEMFVRTTDQRLATIVVIKSGQACGAEDWQRSQVRCSSALFSWRSLSQTLGMQHRKYRFAELPSVHIDFIRCSLTFSLREL